jgi:hypothetical protein
MRRMPAGCWGCCALRGAAPDFVLPEELEKARIAGGFLYLEDRPLDAEEAVEFLLEHAKNESLVVDGQLLKMRDWYHTLHSILENTRTHSHSDSK